MTKPKAFTLVELLVVISIIALLMAILMPALARVRKQAKMVMCQTNLKQWGSIFAMYTGENDGYFQPGYLQNPLTEESKPGEWIAALKPYYKDMDLAYCPMATKCWADGTWPPFASWCAQGWYQVAEGEYGSYGINYWVTNPPEERSYYQEQYYWRRADVSAAAKVPLFLDSNWIGRHPHATDFPPENIYDYGGPPDPGIKDFAIDRHEGGTLNGVFLDFSVQRIGIKQLWTFIWHRTYDLSGPWTSIGGVKPSDWPEWMQYFPEY